MFQNGLVNAKFIYYISVVLVQFLRVLVMKVDVYGLYASYKPHGQSLWLQMHVGILHAACASHARPWCSSSGGKFKQCMTCALQQATGCAC